MSEEEKGFEVQDKRKAKEALDEAGTPDAGGVSGEAASGSPGPGEGPREERAGSGGRTGEHTETLSGIDFLSFISTLAATAFMYLGERVAPDQPAMPVDLPAAKQMIDLLDMLKEKTAGNLDEHEQHGLDSVLYTLRMRFIHESKGR